MNAEEEEEEGGEEMSKSLCLANEATLATLFPQRYWSGWDGG